MKETKFFIYILHSFNHGKYYVGHTSDPFQRLESHNSGERNTYTSKYRPWSLLAIFYCPGSRSDAMKIEKFIKRQKNKSFIDKLIGPDLTLDGVLNQLVRVTLIQ